MALICPACNKELVEGSHFCEFCGCAIPKEEPKAASEERKVYTEIVNVGVKKPQQTDAENGVLPTIAYIGLMILAGIPLIGFITLLILCWAPKNKNLKHFARAHVILAIISTVLLIILALLIANLIGGFVEGIGEFFEEITYGFGEMSGIGEAMGEFSSGNAFPEMDMGDIGELEDLLEVLQ